MKLLIHASLFASGSIEVDTETRAVSFVAPPAIKDDQAILTGDTDAAGIGRLCALVALHKAITDLIVSQSVPAAAKDDPIPLTNVLGGTGKASA